MGPSESDSVRKIMPNHGVKNHAGPTLIWTVFYDFLEISFSVITHHYFNPVLFSCGPCDSAYLALYMNIFSPQVLEIFI